MNEQTTSTELILQQIETLLIFIQRPQVQAQLLAIGLVFVISWPLSQLIKLLQRRIGRAAARKHQQVATILDTILGQIVTPFLVFIGLILVANYFVQNDRPDQLIWAAIPFILFVLAYQLIIGGLYAYGQRDIVRQYHYRVLLPIFIWYLFTQVIGNFIDLSLLGEIPVTTFGENILTLGGIFNAAIIIFIASVIAWIAKDFLTRILLERSSDPGLTYSIATISSYFIIGGGLFTAARSFGLSPATLAVIGGGLSVGIGFGLQQIAANFLSGILLLFEQSLRPGDVIEVNGVLGRVERLSIRSAVVRTNDNIDIVVPNQQFFTSNVTTYTRENTLVRINLDVGVSYQSDPLMVRDVIERTVVQHGKVEDVPPPHIFFVGFGDSSLNFRVGVWINEPRRMFFIRSDLYFMIWKSLEAAGIEIPYPQRDLHLRTGWEQLMPDEKNGDDVPAFNKKED